MRALIQGVEWNGSSWVAANEAKGTIGSGTGLPQRTIIERFPPVAAYMPTSIEMIEARHDGVVVRMKPGESAAEVLVKKSDVFPTSMEKFTGQRGVRVSVGK